MRFLSDRSALHHPNYYPLLLMGATELPLSPPSFSSTDVNNVASNINNPGGFGFSINLGSIRGHILDGTTQDRMIQSVIYAPEEVTGYANITALIHSTGPFTDGQGGSGQYGANVTSLSVNRSVSGDSLLVDDRLMYAAVLSETRPDSVVFHGDEFELVTSQALGGTSDHTLYFYMLKMPDIGTFSMVVTWTDPVNAMVAGQTLNNVEQLSPFLMLGSCNADSMPPVYIDYGSGHPAYVMPQRIFLESDATLSEAAVISSPISVTETAQGTLHLSRSTAGNGPAIVEVTFEDYDFSGTTAVGSQLYRVPMLVDSVHLVDGQGIYQVPGAPNAGTWTTFMVEREGLYHIDLMGKITTENSFFGPNGIYAWIELLPTNAYVGADPTLLPEQCRLGWEIDLLDSYIGYAWWSLNGFIRCGPMQQFYPTARLWRDGASNPDFVTDMRFRLVGPVYTLDVANKPAYRPAITPTPVYYPSPDTGYPEDPHGSPDNLPVWPEPL